ncbi:right-handed parallel beta-helix repeat-containing protein [Siminovitchia fordii]|uniref:Uncharacterized protein n=1 Tax=Siminovitchia fordii TaxID=254759 RepID=A0ABQ4KDI0_9BACI|nr:right-handed parallel beta-helix repeat-containing protein [Siminovitchia fordii]GIN23132.1 hypothetical protein J1TS3_42660 [Siminovitchia fordii]
MDDFTIYNDPILVRKRKGISGDPYKNVTETLWVDKGVAYLRETPSRTERVRVTGTSYPLYEINDGELTKDTYKVDYVHGEVYFHESLNKKSLTFSYLGTGVLYFPDSRIYLTGDKNYGSAKIKFQDIDRSVLEQKNRVDNLIRSTPQPSELVDVRTDRNGKVYSVAKDRIDADQKKIEDVQIDLNGKEYTSPKARVDADQKMVEDAFMSSSRTEILKSLDARIIYDYNELNQNINTKVDNLQNTLVPQIDNLKNIINTEINRIESRIKKEINVIDFGAKGDGVNDDTEALRAALAEAKKRGGGTVIVPYGKYLLRGSLTIYRNTRLLSDEGVVFFRANDYSGYMLKNGDSGDQYTEYNGNGNIIVSGGMWDGRGNLFENGGTLITFGHSENVIFENLILKDVVNNHGIEINSSKNVIVDNCKFLGFRNTGQRDYAEAIQIDRASEAGFPAFGSYDLTPCRNVTIQNCFFGKSGTSGMTGWGRGVGSHGTITASAKHSNINVKNNRFEDTIQWAIYPLHWDDSQITNNKIINCGGGVRANVSSASMFRITIDSNIFLNTGEAGLSNISVVGSADYEMRTVSISNNIIYGVSDKSVSGIYAAYCNGCKIQGNDIRNCGTHGIMVRRGRYYDVSNNSVISCEDTGIYFWTDILYSNISNNSIGYIGLNGIHVTSNVDTLSISGNTISGVNKVKYDGGMGNHIRITDNVDRVSIMGNVCRNIAHDYIATNGLYISSTCTNVNRTGNIFRGIGINDNSGSLVTGDSV